MKIDKIRAFVRIKPQNVDKKAIKILNNNTVQLIKNNEQFTYEYAFDQSSTNKEIFDKTTFEVLKQSLKGNNSCIFTYGQTNSGKTYTMKGTQNQAGIIPLAIEQIFRIAQDTDQRLIIQMKVSYIEIYNQTVNDLLQENNVGLDLRQDPDKKLVISGLTETFCQNVTKALECFQKGEKIRKFSSTGSNQNSSRSHTIFRISLIIIPKTNVMKPVNSIINFVDLAGSESISKTKGEGIMKKQGQNINKSLLALSNVIRTLSQKPASYINYRDSKLTRILQLSLSGNSNTSLICTINPCISNLSQTISTLKFGFSAGQVKFRTISNPEQQSISQIPENIMEQLKTINEQKILIEKELEEKKQCIFGLEEVIDRYKQQLRRRDEEREILIKKSKTLQEYNQSKQNMIKELLKNNEQSIKDFKENDEKSRIATITQTNRQLNELKSLNNKLSSENERLYKNEKIFTAKIASLEQKVKESQIQERKLYINVERTERKSLNLDPLKIGIQFELYSEITAKSIENYYLRKEKIQLIEKLTKLENENLQLKIKLTDYENNLKKGDMFGSAEKDPRRKIKIYKSQISERKRKQNKLIFHMKSAHEKIRYLTEQIQKYHQQEQEIGINQY